MSGTVTSAGIPATAVDHFERVFAAAPDRLALVFLENGDTEAARLTRGALRSRVLAVAATLQETAAPGDRALLVYPSGLDFAIGYLACLYAGLVPVPCYPPSRNRVDHRLAGIAATSDSRLVLTSDRVGAGPGSRFDGYPQLKDVRWLSTTAIDPTGAERWRYPSITSGSTALMQFTSGSTSEPRGVVVSHANLLASFRDMDFGHDEDSVMVTWLPLFHDLGLIFGLLQPLADGFPCVLMPPAAFLQQPVRWLRALTTYRGTHSAAPNFAYDLCVSRVSVEARRGLDLSRWMFALNAAEPVRADTIERFARHFAPVGFNPHTCSPGYGLAEATLRVTCTPAAELTRTLNVDPTALRQHRVTVSRDGGVTLVSSGPPVAETTVVIVDPDTLQPCAGDRVGEIWVGGRTLAQGYYRNSDATEATFAARLDGYEMPFLRTGDLGFLRDGWIYVTGRLKDLVILHGLNYYPQDLERTVEHCHGALAPAGAAAFAIEVNGEERLAIVAEVARTERRNVDAAAVFDAIHRALADAHGVAIEHIALIGPHALPKTSSGKVQRKACRQFLVERTLPLVAEWRRAAARAPETDRTAGDIRQWLITRFSQAIGCPPSAIDTRASLAQLGLDSVGAAEMSGEIEQLLGRPVSATTFYDYPTVEALAGHLAGDAGAGSRATDAAHRSDPHRREGSAPIAVIGIGCRFPQADGPEAFWQLLKNGVDAVGPLAAHRAGQGANAPGGYLDRVDQFDPEFFGISPREAERMDPQQRLVLEVGWEALENAGYSQEAIAGSETGVFIGIGVCDYSRKLMDANTRDIYLGTGSALAIAANRLSYTLDLRGPSLAVDTACSSSLVAMALACGSLRRGECTVAFAGGVNLILDSNYTDGLTTAGMLSPDGRCKTFDAAADGYGRGEGAGVVLLKRLDEAERDGDRIVAVVRGVATNQDGRSAGLTAPNGPAQQAVVRAALADANLEPSRVSYVEAHGTGTPLGDPIEINALASVLGDGRAAGAVCHIGSVKTNIGHLETASGIAGFIKTVLSLQHREIPASLNYRTMNPEINGGDRFVVSTSHRPWVVADGGTRIAGVSAYGFGGSNAHVIVEEYPAASRKAEGGVHVLTLSARSEAALAASVDQHVAWLTAEPAPAFADACVTSNTGRTAMSERAAVAAASSAEAAEALKQWRSGHAAGLRVAAGRAAATPGVVFLYTGQGANYPGMGLELYRRERAFARAIDTCSEIVRPLIGQSIEVALEDVSPDASANMVVSQTCLFAIEHALTELWAAWGVRPAAVIGHSLGEFAAAVAARSLGLEDAARLVVARATLLQSINGDGVMIAAAAAQDVIEGAIEPWRSDLSIAAVNGASNVVFSGRRQAADAAAAVLTGMGVRHMPLTVAQAFHSPLVDGVLDQFAAEASRARFARPQTKFCSTVTGTWLTDPPEAGYWRRQLRAPVLFMQAMTTARQDGLDTFLETGPHPVLATLGEQIASDRRATWAASLHRDRSAALQIRRAAAELWTGGATIDWREVNAASQGRKIALPTYPFQRSRYWVSSEPAARPGQAGPSHTYEVQWFERRRNAEAAPRGLRWALVADQGGVAEWLAWTLEHRGDRVAIVNRRADMTQALARAADECGGSLDRLVHLCSLDVPNALSLVNLREATDLGVHSLLGMLRALDSTSQARVWLVTRRSTAAGGDVSDAGVLQSPLWGVGRNLAVEHPDRWGAAIDLDATKDLDPLIGELTVRSVTDDQVSFRSGRRLVWRVAPIDWRPERRITIDAEASYLITGGLGALGLAIARTLVDAGARRLVLLSRSGINGDERRAAVSALTASGAEVKTPAIDVTDQTALRALIDRLAETGRVGGVVHAAGEAGFTTMLEMTPRSFAGVFSAKAEGALALAQATAGLPIDFFVMMSSMSSVWAGEGQAHYVAANHFADVLAQRLRQTGRRASSIGFGPLRGGLMPAAIAERLARTGVATWEMSRAATMALDAAGSARAHTIAVELDWSVFGARRAATRSAPATVSAPQGWLQATLLAAAPADRNRLIADAVLKEAAAVLGMDPAAWGDTRRGFFDIGMDSLTAVELRKRFEVLLGRTLPVTLVFDNANLDALSRAVHALLFGETLGLAPTVAAGRDRASATVGASPQSTGDDLTATLERLERLVAGTNSR